MSQGEILPPTRREGVREAVMFWLACAFLLVLGAVVHRHRTWQDVPREERTVAQKAEKVLVPHLDLDNPEVQIELWILGLLWPVFVVEAYIRYLQRDRSRPRKKDLFFLIAVCLMPPVRLGARYHGPGEFVWFPRLGWRSIDKSLRKTLEKYFSVPMILIALMVLPVLAIEYGWESAVRQNKALGEFITWANTIIWFAFAVEFLVMISVAKKKLRYAVSQWINLLIILLPLIEFLPLLRVLRLSRVLRLNKLSKMGRLYRLRGLALRAWRAILILGVLQRLFGGKLENRLERLEELLVAKQEEIEELEAEILEVKELIAERDAKSKTPSVGSEH